MRNQSTFSLISGNVTVDHIKPPSYQWAGRLDEDRELLFEQAYQIERADWDKGIEDCVYRIHDRTFCDLSGLSGETIHKTEDGFELRRHSDGTVFLFSCIDIPTFDAGDREWDSMSHLAVYRDEQGINMIHCTHGYKIPRIGVYISLLKGIPAFLKWIEILETWGF